MSEIIEFLGAANFCSIFSAFSTFPDSIPAALELVQLDKSDFVEHLIACLLP